MKILKEKYINIPTNTEALDMYYDECCVFDDDYFNGYVDNYWSYNSGHNEYSHNQQIYYYAYIKPLDKFISSQQKLKNFSNCGNKEYDIYEDKFGDTHAPVYSIYAPTKIEAFLGCIMLTINGESGNVSEKIKNLYDKLSNEYPEVLIKLIGKV